MSQTRIEVDAAISDLLDMPERLGVYPKEIHVNYETGEVTFTVGGTE